MACAVNAAAGDDDDNDDWDEDWLKFVYKPSSPWAVISDEDDDDDEGGDEGEEGRDNGNDDDGVGRNHDDDFFIYLSDGRKWHAKYQKIQISVDFYFIFAMAFAPCTVIQNWFHNMRSFKNHSHSISS